MAGGIGTPGSETSRLWMRRRGSAFLARWPSVSFWTRRRTLFLELSKEVRQSVRAEVAKAREGLSEGQGHQVVVDPLLRYRITVEILTESGQLRVMDERLEALKADGTRTPADARLSGRRWPRAGSALRREEEGHTLYEEIGQDRPIASKRLYPPHYPHISALGEELARWRTYYLEPSAMRRETPLREVTVLPPDGSDWSLCRWWATRSPRTVFTPTVSRWWAGSCRARPSAAERGTT